jgi:hypothetical protein
MIKPPVAALDQRRHAGPGRSIGRVPDAPGSVAVRCAGSRLGGSKFPEHDDLSSFGAGAWTFLAPKTSASNERQIRSTRLAH